jgi:hypothetical protein
VLLRVVLRFRNILIKKPLKTTTNPDGTVVEETLNIDPFSEASTIPSLASKINRDHFLPKNTIEAFTDSKTIQSKIASHWRYHLTTHEQVELHPEFYLKLIYNPKTHQLTPKYI